MNNFSVALAMLKDGRKMRRAGWNGKGMFIYTGGCALPLPPLPENEKWDFDAFPLSTIIVMKTADSRLVPWLASQPDILADDWEAAD